VTDRRTLDLTPKKGVVMWHTCLCLAQDGSADRVSITTNPLEFDDRAHKALIVHHKTRSYNCAVQVARAVRRHYDIQAAVVVHRSTRPVEAKIGYACTRSTTYPPEYVRDEINEFVLHVAATPISELLRESAGGYNAARSRYIVYEARGDDARRRPGPLPLDHEQDARGRTDRGGSARRTRSEARTWSTSVSSRPANSPRRPEGTSHRSATPCGPVALRPST
jgi:hypothetical protein